MGSKGGGTQGYRYYMSILSGFGRGPIDELVEIVVGDKSAWIGHACSDDEIIIQKPNLFGGDDKEGGINGTAKLLLGHETQTVPERIKPLIGGRVPDLLGVTTFWFDGMVSAMTPYLKTWKFRVRRSQKGWYKNKTWYKAKATIVLGGDALTVSTSQAMTHPVSQDEDGNITVNYAKAIQIGDSITINGYVISFVEEADGDGEITHTSSPKKNVSSLVNYINRRIGQFKVSASMIAGPGLLLKPDAKSSQILAMNGAHILYQAFTDPLWGRGLPAEEMGPSWVYAADTLCAERFGIALIWYRKEELSVFMQRISDLLAAITYTDRSTGLIEIKLIRNDYVVDDLPHFTPQTGLLSIEEDDSASADNSYNEIIGTSVDPVTNQKIQVRAQNPAARLSQGSVSSLDQDYKGIPTKELLARVTLRDLRAMASGLKKFTLKLDRRAWRLTPGSVIRVSHPLYDLANVVLRIGEIDDGNLVNGTITCKAMIDVFGLPETSYLEPKPPSWAPPSDEPVPPPARTSVELSYRDMYLRQGEPDTLALDPTFGYIGGLAQAPSPILLSYDFVANPPNWNQYPAYAETQPGQFTGVATVFGDVDPMMTQIPVSEMQDIGPEHIGQALHVSYYDEAVEREVIGELVELISIADDNSYVIVRRGCGDTVPRRWPDGTSLWTIDDDLTVINYKWPLTYEVDTNHLTNSNQGRLDPELAGDTYRVEIAGRHALPYPPAAVHYTDGTQLSVLAPDQPVRAEPSFSWAERNRVLQADKLVDWFDISSVQPEDGTTYTIEIRDETLLRTVDGIVAQNGVASFSYTAAMQAQDAVKQAGVIDSVRISIWSVRNGARSYQAVEFVSVIKSGFGLGWGFTWGK